MATTDNISKEKKPKNSKNALKWLKRNVGEIRLELKRVTWPTWRELFNYTITVLLVCLVMGGLICLLDIGLNRLLVLTLQVGL